MSKYYNDIVQCNEFKHDGVMFLRLQTNQYYTQKKK